MMAKMFYTLEETKAALGKNEEEVKQFSREGRLREFRDGPRLMFKADQVEALKAEMGGSDQVDLGPSDSGAPIGLVDSKSASGTGVTLSDSDIGRAAGTVKEDTALAADLGLSGSVGGVPSPGRAGSRTGSGINVLGDTGEHADPGAQTNISGSRLADQVQLESVGSGSGLLDLTRESDDTSLGAELLDEIAPGGTATGTRGGSAASASAAATATAGGSVVDTTVPRPIGRVVGPPVYVVRSDAMSSGLGWAALGGVIFCLFGAFALISALSGTRPDLIVGLEKQSFGVVTLIGLGVALVLFVIGLIVGKSTQR